MPNRLPSKEESIVKPMKVGLLVAAVVLAAGVTTAFAAPIQGTGQTCATCGTHYVDANGDGLCDHCAASRHCGTCSSNYVDANRDGICDNCAANQQSAAAPASTVSGTASPSPGRGNYGHHACGTHHTGHHQGGCHTR